MANDELCKNWIQNLLKLTLPSISVDSPCTNINIQVLGCIRIHLGFRLTEWVDPSIEDRISVDENNGKRLLPETQTKHDFPLLLLFAGRGEWAKLREIQDRREAGERRVTLTVARLLRYLPLCRAKFGISKQTNFIRSPVDDEIRIAER